MAAIALWALVLVVSLVALLRAADAFLTAAERIGLRLGVAPFVIGITVVAFGTSLPELLSAVVAVLRGASEIAVGTVVGSNVTNILLILPAAAILGGGLRVETELVRVDLPFLFGSALLLLLFAFDGAVGWLEGLLSIAGLAIYVAYAATDEHAASAGRLAPDLSAASREVPAWRTGTGLVLGLAVLQLAAWGAVESVLQLSGRIGVASEVLAASVIALGTSLPELAVTVRASLRGTPEVAVGNVIGSNIFNALGVLGVAALFGTVDVPASMLGFAVPAMIAATALCFFVLQERVMTRWDGWLLLLLYAAFTGELYGLFSRAAP